jgi:hypothetical protein
VPAWAQAAAIVARRWLRDGLAISLAERRLVMKLTRHEIVLFATLVFALVVGGLVKRYRAAHPAPLPLAEPLSKNNSRATVRR